MLKILEKKVNESKNIKNSIVNTKVLLSKLKTLTRYLVHEFEILVPT